MGKASKRNETVLILYTQRVLSGVHTAHDIVRHQTMSYDVVRSVNTALCSY